MKAVNFQIDDILHKKMKFEALRQGKSVKQYVTNLIQKDLETKKEQTQ